MKCSLRNESNRENGQTVSRDIPQKPEGESAPDRFQDRFYQGVIHKIASGNETGVVLSDSGKEIPFVFPFLRLIGAPRLDIRFLTEGMRVGFDVGWTSDGLRISALKIYD